MGCYRHLLGSHGFFSYFTITSQMHVDENLILIAETRGNKLFSFLAWFCCINTQVQQSWSAYGLRIFSLHCIYLVNVGF